MPYSGDPDALPPEWIRSDYMEMQLPTADGSVAQAPAPAVPIRLQNPMAATLPDAPNVVRGRGMIATGAARSCVPMWAVQELGIVPSDEDKEHASGAGGRVDAYRVRVRIEAWIGGRWLDMGVVTALSPDTEWSRRGGGSPPFLLGRDGFLDKFSVWFDERGKTMRLRRIDGARAERPRCR